MAPPTLSDSKQGRLREVRKLAAQLSQQTWGWQIQGVTMILWRRIKIAGQTMQSRPIPMLR